MPVESEKSRDAEKMLPETLRPIYRKLVEDYEFLTTIHYGRGYVAYKVVAELVLAGWRPSSDIHPASSLTPK